MYCAHTYTCVIVGGKHTHMHTYTCKHRHHTHAHTQRTHTRTTHTHTCTRARTHATVCTCAHECECVCECVCVCVCVLRVCVCVIEEIFAAHSVCGVCGMCVCTCVRVVGRGCALHVAIVLECSLHDQAGDCWSLSLETLLLPAFLSLGKVHSDFFFDRSFDHQLLQILLAHRR